MNLRRTALRALVMALVSPLAFAQADWKQTLAAANKEGALVVLTAPSPAFRETVQGAWKRDHPAITLTLTTMQGDQFFTRIKTERSTGRFLWDASITGAINSYDWLRGGFLDPLLPELVDPEVNDPKVWGGWDNAFYDNEKRYVFGMQQILRQIFYNAKLVSPDTVKAKGLDILFDPALKGKVLWLDPNLPGAGQSLGFVMRKTLGDEKLRQFITSGQVVFLRTPREIGERMARGLAAISMGPTPQAMLQPFEKAGVKIDIRPLGNTPELGTFVTSAGTAMTIFNRRPHPNATRVFVNWILSQRIQAELSKGVIENSRRADVPPVVPPDRSPVRGLAYLDPVRQANEPEVDAAIDWLKQVRGL